MGILSVDAIKKTVEKAANAAADGMRKGVSATADGVAGLARLTREEVRDIDAARQEYLKAEDENATQKDSVERCLQAINIEIMQAYLAQLDAGYCPLPREREALIADNCIRYFDITKWVVDTSEKSLDKLTNLYQVLAKERCTIALIYTRRTNGCTATLAVANGQESDQPTIANGFCNRICQALQGNFPGAEISAVQEGTPIALLDFPTDGTVAAVSNLASERSENFISQSIEKLLDGVVPQAKEEEYAVVLLAQPSVDLAVRRARLYDLYSDLSPYAAWQKAIGSNEMLTKTATATVGLQAGTGGSNHVGFGGNFSRASVDSRIMGVQKVRTRSYTDYAVKHMLELLVCQVKRLEECSVLGMWEFAAYVLSPDYETAINVANMYLSLTQGEKSYLEQAAINVWSSRDPDKLSAESVLPWLQALQHPVFALSQEKIRENTNWQVFPTLVTAATVISGSELARALNFPRKSIQGLPVYECVPFGREVVQYGHDFGRPTVPLGHIYHMRKEEGGSVTLDRDSLTTHTFITGSTGAGKSNAIYTLLDKLCLNENSTTKFLIIEPAKGEYKEVLGGYRGVRIYGTNPYKAPLLRLNPFSFPEDIHVLEHIDRLIEIFNACWPMYAAMPAVLKAAVEQAYLSCGWSLSMSKCAGSRVFPTFRDVVKALPKVVDSKGFSKDTQGDYKGALHTRLESLTNGINGQVLCAYEELSEDELFDQNTIVDLSRVGSSETKALLMGILILKLQEHRMAQRADGTNKPNSGLRHITILEEAHNLLRRTSMEQSQESSNLQGKSVEMLTNAIAEMRTYGEGFIIADQSPGLLDVAVIRNTNTKLILRLPDENDRILVGKAAGLNDDQIVELSRLDTGVAAVYQNHWLEPVLCKISEFKKERWKKLEFSASKPLSSADNLSDTVCQILINNIPDDTLQEQEGLDQIRIWIDRQNTGREAKRLISKILLERKTLSQVEQQYMLYSLVDGKPLIEEVRRIAATPERSNAAAIERIMENLSVSEKTAREICTIVFLYAADKVKSDETLSQELRAIGGVR